MSVTHSPVQTRKEEILPLSALTWSFDGDIYPSGYNDIYWSDGNLNFSNDVTYLIASGNENIVDTEYMYWDVTNSGLFLWGSPTDCIGNGIVPIGVAIEHVESGQEASLRVFQGPGLNITADNIATNTLSAISANMGNITAGVISGIEIYGSTITGGILQTAIAGQRVVVDGADNTLKFYDASELKIIIDDGLQWEGVPSIEVYDGYFFANKDDEEVIVGWNNGTFNIRVETDSSRFGVLSTCNYAGAGVDSYSLWAKAYDITANTYNRLRIAIYGDADISNIANTSQAIGMLSRARSVNATVNGIGVWSQCDDITLRLSTYTTPTTKVDFSVDSSGNLTIDPSGSYVEIPSTNYIRAAYDQDVRCYFGKSAVGFAGPSDHAGFAHLDSSSTTGYALLQASNGATMLNAPTGQVVNFRINNINVGDFSSTGFNVVGQYEMDGSAIIDTSGYQTGVLKTRQILAFGRSPSWTKTDGSDSQYAETVDGGSNGQGYRMSRAGKVVGISLQFDVTNASGGWTRAQLYKNGAAVSGFTATDNSVGSTGDHGASATPTAETFAANDTLNIMLTIADDLSDQITVANIATILEIEA